MLTPLSSVYRRKSLDEETIPRKMVFIKMSHLLIRLDDLCCVQDLDSILLMLVGLTAGRPAVKQNTGRSIDCTIIIRIFTVLNEGTVLL